METFLIKFTANLYNATDLQPVGGDESSFGCSFEMKCNRCGEIKTKGITVIPDEEWPNIRKPPSTMFKCDSCQQNGTVLVDISVSEPLTGEIAVKEDYTPLLQLKCNGFAPVECVFGAYWKAYSVTEGIMYNNIDLSEGEYEVYHECGELQIGIYQPNAFIEMLQIDKKSEKYGGRESSMNLKNKK